MIMLTFDARLRGADGGGSSPRDILARRLGVSAVVAGYDFRFGAGAPGRRRFSAGRGRAARLCRRDRRADRPGRGRQSRRRLLDRDARSAGARRRGARPPACSATPISSRASSSTATSAGAARLSDRQYRARSRPIGCDTAIYAVTLEARRRRASAGVASFGRRPTFDNGPPLLEVFVFDFSGDLYGEEVEVAFYGFLRGEEKFGRIDALIAQMNADAAAAREILARRITPPRGVVRDLRHSLPRRV